MKSGHLQFVLFLLLNLIAQEREKGRSSFLVLLPENLTLIFTKEIFSCKSSMSSGTVSSIANIKPCIYMARNLNLFLTTEVLVSASCCE